MKNKLLLLLFILSNAAVFAQSVTLIDILTPNRTVNCQALQSDGKILVGGGKPFTGGNYALARLNPDGSMDPTFNNGIEIEGAGEKFSVLRIQADGKILAVTGGAIKRFNADGSVDNSFQLSGLNPIMISDIQIIADNKLLVLYSRIGGQVTLSRLSMNGSLDTSFGSTGEINGLNGTMFYPQQILVQEGGSSVISHSVINSASSTGFIRFSSQGIPTNGGSLPYANFVSFCGISNGAIVVAATNSSHYPTNNFVYNSNLSGNFTYMENVDLTERAVMKKQSDGKFLSLGLTNQLIEGTNISINVIKMVRLNANGTIDTNFGTQGTYTFPNMNGFEAGIGMDLTTNNKAIVIGNKNNYANFPTEKPFLAIIDGIDLTPTGPTAMVCPLKGFSQSIGGHNLKISGDNTLWAVGADEAGQLGLGQIQNNPHPNKSIQVGTDADWVYCYAGYRNSFAIKTNGTLWGWGDNDRHQVSPQTLNPPYSAVPLQIGTDSNWAQVTCSGHHVLALKTDGTLWAWGTNQQGQLGLGTYENISVPTQVGNDTWQSIDAADDFMSAGIKSDGTLWTWGMDYPYGRLGQGTQVLESAIPIQVGTDNNWQSISLDYGILATKNDGTLWGWGNNYNGVMGNNMPTVFFTPTQIGSDSNWASAVSQYTYTLALKMDGTLWKMQNYTITQIGTDSDWTAINAGYGFNFAQKTNLDLYGWGYMSDVLLGNNSSSPVTVPTLINNCDTLSNTQSPTENQSLTIYPNPSNDKINFSQDIQSASLYSIDGRLMNSNLQNNQMNVSSLPNGLYLVRGLTNENKTFSGKIIKN